jgi:DNA gyrase subunit A
MNNYQPANLENQVKEDYLAYSMAILVGRAIPDLYDGMKPVHRRILAAMKWLNLKPEGRYMKSARVEGEVMGKLHPHGSAYGAMVTLGAPWSNNLPLIDSQGNWGSSVDGPAASRYTECKLSPFSWDCLLDDSEVWSTTENYDGSLQEPVRLNVKIPAVLLNGQEGIGVGFATKVPPHDLRDICDAVVNGTTLAPSFSTGCDIVNDEGLRQYQETGSGSIRCRARVETGKQERARGKDRFTLTFTHLPPGCNPEKLGEQVKNELEKGRIENVAEVIDESDRSGDRVTVVTKPGADVALVQRQLFAYTDLDTKFPAKMLLIDNLKPVELNPQQVISRWKTWRLSVLEKKFEHEQDLKMQRLEVVMGFLKAIDKIDAVIKIIRASKSSKEALVELVSNRAMKFTADQARAILEMRLRQLTGLDAEELAAEKEELEKRLATLKGLIESEAKRSRYMLDEVKKIGTRHGEKRRSQLIEAPDSFAAKQPDKDKAPSVAKPRYMVIDKKKGLVSQAKGPRGAMVVERHERVILMTNDGVLKKVTAAFKGPIGTGYSEVVLARRESDVLNRNYLLVFTLEGQLKAVSIKGEDLCRTTSRGKGWLPSMAQLVYFGEGTYTVPWSSPRKKALTLHPERVRQGRPGAKGQVVANLEDVSLEAG